MKKILFIAAMIMMLASSCGRKVEFEHMTFATFDASSYSFDENVQEFRIPVKIVNPNGMEISLSVTTNDGKAEEGVDYEIIYPVSGVLAFASGETEQDIVIGITEFPGKLTGSKDFTVEISSVTEGISVGGCNTVKMKIMDLDHPLKAFIGKWTAQAGSAIDGSSYTWDVFIEGDESDYTTLVISDLCPVSAKFLGLTSEMGYNIVEAKAVDGNQKIKVAGNSYIGPYDDTASMSVYGMDATGQYLDDLYISLDGKGGLVIENGWLEWVSLGGYMEMFAPGTVFVKK